MDEDELPVPFRSGDGRPNRRTSLAKLLETLEPLDEAFPVIEDPPADDVDL